MKKEKLGFFKKLFLVITDFRTYPFLVKNEKFIKSICYLVTLTLFMSIFFTGSVVLRFNSALNSIIENYEETIPEFELVDGTLTVDAKYKEKINSESFLVVDTDYTYEEYKKTKEYSTLIIYDTITLVNSDKIIIEVANEPLYNLQFNDFNYETNKSDFYNEIITRYENLNYIPYLITVYISIFIGYFIAILTKVIIIACLISIICSLTGIRLNFKNYMKIAIYAYSLPLLVELISYCLVGAVKDYAYYTTLLLTYIYIIYAIRAIRLDAFIMMFSQKTNGKHTTTEFEKELKKYNELVNNEEIKEEKSEEAKDEKTNTEDEK